ncbi:aminotransferase [Curtobacterium sp. 'Ferrero']|nr:aminotransferase [Curtobacterium sp. 'Ferrero']
MRFGAMETLDEQDARVRTVAARLVGRRDDQVVSQTATTPGLVHTAFGLTGGVLVAADDYPAMPLALASAASSTGGRVHPVVIESGVGWATPELIRERLTDEVTAVAVSLVDWRTGYLVDLAAMREVVGDRLLIVDAIQGFGIVDAAYDAADVVATGGQKWLHAGWGTGFTAFSDRALNRLRPALSGPAGTTGWPAEVPSVKSGAGAFVSTRIDPVAQARMAVSLERLAGVGVAAVQEAVAERVERVFDIADEFGLVVESSRDPRERAGIVALRPPQGRLTALSAALHNHGVTVTTRLGVARVSVFASTTDETLDMFRDACLSYATMP